LLSFNTSIPERAVFLRSKFTWRPFSSSLLSRFYPS